MWKCAVCGSTEVEEYCPVYWRLNGDRDMTDGPVGDRIGAYCNGCDRTDAGVVYDSSLEEKKPMRVSAIYKRLNVGPANLRPHAFQHTLCDFIALEDPPMDCPLCSLRERVRELESALTQVRDALRGVS